MSRCRDATWDHHDSDSYHEYDYLRAPPPNRNHILKEQKAALDPDCIDTNIFYERLVMLS